MKATIVRNMFTQTRPLGILTVSLMALSGLGVKAGGTNETRFQQTDLVSDQPGVAQLQDTNLVNAWGVSFNPTGPFWVSDNGTGLATLYSVTNDASGAERVVKNPLEVTIPGAGTPTGQLFNNTTAFRTNLFIFASEDGTISGWRPTLGTAAEVLTNRASAVYKGITLATNGGRPVLLAANFREGTIDMYDGNLNLLGQFSDSAAPIGFAPFNVQNRDGVVFVTFAKQDAAQHDDVAGPGNGLIDTFNPTTGALTRFVTGSSAGGQLQEINSPWGVAIAPAGFGDRGGKLLVGNFGDGTIMTFGADGRFRGLLKGADGQPIAIDGLWALTFGNGGQAGTPNTLFFSSGPNNEQHGLFGSLKPITGQANGNGNTGNGH